jgi:hypothetical protein
VPAIERWPPWEVESLQRQLADLVATIKRLDDSKDEGVHEIQAWLARLLVVRACGYLEQVVFEVFRHYVDGRSGGLVRVFARGWLERTRNPGPDALEEWVARFDASLRDELVLLLDEDDQYLRRELAFLVDRRNRIAHGLNEGIGSRKALLLVDVARRIADWFVLRFNPA